MESTSEANHNQVIRIYLAQTKQVVHELPPIVSEGELVLASRKDKAKKHLPLEELCSLILERLSTSVEGSVYHVDDFCNAFREKRNIGVPIYDLFNVLEALGYLKKVKKGMFTWLGLESDQAAKTLRALKTIAINHDGLDDFDVDDNDTASKITIPKLTEKVVMIFLSVNPTQTISFHQIFFQAFKENQVGSGNSAKLSKVLKVLEVIGLIVHVDHWVVGKRKRSHTDDSYHYAGPAIEGYSSIEEIGKIEADFDYEGMEETNEVVKIEAETDNEDLENMDIIHEETAPKKELILGEDEDGNWIIRDNIPVSSEGDNLVVGKDLELCKEEAEDNSPDSDEFSGKEDNIVGNGNAGLIDVKDEILAE